MKRLAVATVLLAVLATGGIWLLLPGATPNVALNYTNGTNGQLSDLKGQPVVINFWGVNCPVCIKEAPHWAELHPQLAANNIALIGASIPQDPPAAIMSMLQALNPPYPTVFDVHGELSRTFQTRDITPTTIILDREGKIAARMVGALRPTQLLETLATL